MTHKDERNRTNVSTLALLSVDEMYRADRAAATAGVPSLDLMEAAGAAIARSIRQTWRPRRVTVLCGPGNNGGDGFVVARRLDAAGWPVRVGVLGDAAKLKGDAAVNRDRWTGEVQPLTLDLLDRDPLVIDALFGAGLARAVEGTARDIITAINERGLDCVGVDVPSGVDGNTGAILGTAPACRLTVTFFRPKPGHLLMPARPLCGRLVVADIGIPEHVLDDIAPKAFMNGPALWRHALPTTAAEGNKYTRGHVVVAGGPMTGAGRLSAEAARRIGAGMVTIATDPESYPVYAAGRPGTIVTAIESEEGFRAFIGDKRRTAALIGPGAGVSAETRRRVEAILATGKPCVLDADALTVFKDDPPALFRNIRGPCVMTPHDGEFARLFDPSGDKPARTRRAARASGAVIVLKGPDTAIAAPDCRVAINALAPPSLATAGSGDVLAGMIIGLMAQGMAPFEAAAAAVWMHGAGADTFGRGLVAEDIVHGIPSVLNQLFVISHNVL